jgi:hypothetical protein
MDVLSQRGRRRAAAASLPTSLSLSLSSRLPNLQQLWPKVEGEGELVATDTDIGEGSNGSRLVTTEGGRCDGKEWRGVQARKNGTVSRPLQRGAS